jgi:hypothetical protein
MKRKYQKVDIEHFVKEALEISFQKTGDHDAALEYIISQYVHLFGEIPRHKQVEQMRGFKNMIVEIE